MEPLALSSRGDTYISRRRFAFGCRSNSPTNWPSLAAAKVFVGPRGLRAGWKVPIFFLTVFAVGFFLRPLDKLTGKPDPKLPVAPGASFSTGAAIESEY